MRRATMGLFAAASALVLAGAASAATVTFLGSEINTDGNPTHTWAQGATFGWRTAGAGYAKAYDADGNDVYGSDGYILYNSDRYGNEHTLTTGSAPGDAKTATNITPYIGQISVTAGVPRVDALQGGGDTLQDPTNPSTTVQFGCLMLNFDNPMYGSDAIGDFLDISVSQAKTFTIGLEAGRGDRQKPITMLLNGVSATRAANFNNNYDKPDWYFFSVTTTGPEVLKLQLQREGTGQQAGIDAIVFDSPVPEPTSLGLLSLGGLALLRRRR